MIQNLLRRIGMSLLLLSLVLSSGFLYAQPVVGLQSVGSGLDQPIEIVAPPDNSGRLFIVQQRGRIRIFNGTSFLPGDFLNISSLLSTGGEQGLLSMAFHPDYATNGLFYVYYTNTGGAITISAYTVSSSDPNVANTTAEAGYPLAPIPKPFDNHNGGHLQFRVEGGVNYLYFATGDGGSGNDPNNNAQNPASQLGKMLRFNVDAPTPTIEQWAIGLRNPFRWSFDRNTGDIWIGDVGQGLREEVDFLAGGVSGANYGWRCFEGTLQNADVTACSPPGAIAPVFEYNNPLNSSTAVTGGYVYRGTEFPALQGYYIASDFYSGQIWLIRSPSAGTFAVYPQTVNRTFISAFGEAQDGTMYAVSMATNQLYKVIVTAVLPVNLLSFSGSEKNGFNELSWTTTSEQGAGKFIIEYSTDGTNFSVAGEVSARGSTAGASYSFNHTASTGTIMYRLKMVDMDGSAKYSPVISIRKTGASQIRVYPTVVTSNIVQVVADKRIDQAIIYSMEGRVITTKTINSAGYFTIQLPSLQKGMYVIKLKGVDGEKSEKIFVQ